MKYLKKYYKYILLFFFFFFLLSFLCFENTSFDFLWEYGFSHAIRIGEIPYKDFNTIATPLYIFIMSLFLRINDSFMMYIGVQALLCTIMSFILINYVGKKSWLVFAMLAFPFFTSLIGSYNFFTFLLIIILFYLEDNSKNDFYVGIVLGLLILSKQTIGGVVVLFNLLFLHNRKRCFNRFKGLLIPCLIFFIYLVFSNSLYNFIDLCFLGLFDFGHSNGTINYLFVVSIVFLLGVIVSYYKTKNIKCSYLIGGFFFAFPLFSFYHCSLFFALVMLYFSTTVKYNIDRVIFLSKVLFIVILLFNIFVKLDFYKNLVFLDLNHFKYYLVQKQDKKRFNKILSKYKSYNSAIMIGTEAMLYDIALDKKISFYDMPLTGNYGYKGTKGMIKRVKDMHEQVFFIDICTLKDLRDETQVDYYLIEYVISNSKKIDSVLCYNVYYKE